MFDLAKPMFFTDTSAHSSATKGEPPASSVAFVPASSGEDYWVLGGLFSFLVTGAQSNGCYLTLIVEVAPGSGPPPHIHHNEEEQFYVLEGHLVYFVGDQSYQANPGDFIHIPREAVHWFKNGDAPARLLATFAPAGIEGFFRVIGERADDRRQPPPPVTQETINRLMAAEAEGWRDHHDTLPMRTPGS